MILKNPKIKLVAAYCPKNRVMGKDGKLPWRYKLDLNHFKVQVNNCILIAGPKTTSEVLFLKQPILTWTREQSFEDLLRFAISAAKQASMDIAIVGGAKVFELGLKYADELILTEIQKEYDGDTFFPTVPIDFKLRTEMKYEEEQDLVFKFYERK